MNYREFEYTDGMTVAETQKRIKREPAEQEILMSHVTKIAGWRYD